MKRFFVCTVLVFLTVSLPQQALSKVEDIASYEDALEIPEMLKMGLKRNSYYEKFIADSLSVIRSHASDNKALTQEDLDRIKNQNEEKRRSSQVKKLIAYDTNYDGKVSLKDEVDQAIRSKARENTRPEQLKRMYESISKYDLDEDGVLTYEEMATVEPVVSTSNRYGGRYDPKVYLDLDPNEDGKLTIDELEAIASKAFYTVDQDKDGIISKAERDLALPKKPVRSWQNRNTVSAECKFPEVGENQTTGFIGVHEGKAVSNVSVAGQVEETNVIPVHIASGEEDMYLVMSSFSPVIWKFEGDTSRIKQLVLAGPSIKKGTNNNDLGGDHINVGAIGISENIVTYQRARLCGLGSGYDTKSEKKKTTIESLKKLLGKEPDYFFANYGVVGISILNGRINEDVSNRIIEEQKVTPKGFNASLWKRHLRHMPGGLIMVNPEDVVSEADAELYEVLPKWAGISKLVYEGAIIPIKNGGSSVIINRPGKKPLTLTNIETIKMDDKTRMNLEFESTRDLKIVKDIPYYPSGLHGGYLANFIIAKGVKPPKGDAGHSKVRFEE